MTRTSKLRSLIDVVCIPHHEPEHTVEGANHVYSYSITITNRSEETVQLERRHWYISDGLNYDREVEGKGVVGENPVLKPGDSFTYQSWVPLISEYGVMSGYYTFTVNGDEFDVEIPHFVLQPEYQLN